ncbi:MAG: FIVAR domain-containing protein [Coriobacteriales bacterium]|nr:FIVAR domain-containing protein [Coriobacteriales bacterium]
MAIILALLLVGGLVLPLPFGTIVAYAAGTEYSVGTYADLSTRIQNATNGDVIRLTADIDVSAGGSFYSSSGAGRTITIKGDGHTIKQTGTKPLFSFAYGNITFENVKFDGNAKTMNIGNGGSALYSTGATLTVKDSEFVSCVTNREDGGGAIHSRGTLNISDCLFVNNRSSEMDGGAILIGAGSAAITNSTFTGNYAEYDGGAVAVEAGSAAITNCTFYGNTAYEHGGAIADLSSSSGVRIKNTIAIGNTVESSTSTKQHSADVEHSYGASNSTSVIDAGNNLFGKIGTGSAALKAVSTSKRDVANSPAWLDTALKNNGGSTRTLALLDVASSPARDKGASGSGVPATDQRGVSRDATPDIGAYEYYVAPPATVSGVAISPQDVVLGKGDTRTFTAEVAGENGPSPEVTWSVSGATSANTKVTSTGLSGPGATAQGALSVAADEAATTFTVTATSVTDTSKSASATVSLVGEFDVATGAEYNNAMLSGLNPLIINITADLTGVDAPALATAREVVINGNGHTLTQAPAGVSARLEAVAAGNRLTINDLSIIGDAVPTNYKNGGGAVYLAKGDVILNNVSIQNCSVEYKNDPGNQNGLRFGGGAVSVALTDPPNSSASNGSITATNCTFTNNTVGHTFDNFGGGALGADKVYLTNCTFWGNKVLDGVGGAVYARLGGEMVNCTVVSNAAGVAGGGVVSRTNEVNGNFTRLHLLNCIVVGNYLYATPDGVDGVSSATFRNGHSGINVDQVYDQGGNIFGYVHTVIDADYRDLVYSSEGLRKEGPGSVWNVSDAPDDLKKWLDYALPKDNGGATPTIALKDLYDSPAIDKGRTAGSVDANLAALAAPASDQRGVARDDGKLDVGAYEYTGARAAYKGALQDLVAAVEEAGYTEADYTTASWAALSSALALAKAALADDAATQQQVDEAKDVLVEAVSALTSRASAGDLAYLEAMVNFVESKVGGSSAYTTDSWTRYAAALAQAQDILAAPAGYSSVEVESAADALLAACQELKRVVDKSLLAAAVEAAEEILANPQLIPSYRDALAQELEKARALLADPDATWDQVTDAFEALLSLIGVETEAGDKTRLTALAKIASKLDSAVWTPASLAPVAAALTQAQYVVDDPEAVQSEVESAEAALQDALDGLTRRADFSALAAVVARAEAVIAATDDYVPSTIAGLSAATQAATAVLDDANATQAEVNAARDSLVAELLKARKKANFKQLNAALQTASALDLSAYTSASVKSLSASLERGRTLLALSHEEVTQEMVDTATSDILVALASLVLRAPNVEPPAGQPGGSGGGANGSGGSSTGSSGSTGSAGSAGVSFTGLAGLGSVASADVGSGSSTSTANTAGANTAAQDRVQRSESPQAVAEALVEDTVPLAQSDAHATGSILTNALFWLVLGAAVALLALGFLLFAKRRRGEGPSCS